MKCVAGVVAVGLAMLLGGRAVAQEADWLIEPSAFGARVIEHETSIELTNGLVSRVFHVGENLACVSYDNLSDGRSMLRAVQPEARVTIDGVSYDVGGLTGQPNAAWLDPAWLADMHADPEAFVYIGHEIAVPVERFGWARVRHASPEVVWPPTGAALRIDFAPGAAAPEALAGVTVSVNYELYDGLPAMSKWVTVRNGSAQAIEIDRFTAEILAAVEHGSSVETREGTPLSNPRYLHVETDYAFGSFTHDSANRFAVHWRPDPAYLTQVNYQRANPCLLEVEPEHGPDVWVGPDETFESFRVFELAHDSGRLDSRERRGLALRRFYRVVAPWVTENPLILHVVSTDQRVVRTAIDQAAECGFEMVSLSFGSGLSMEDTTAANQAKFRSLAKYAGSKGIHLGGYSLLASRRIQPDSDNAINPETGDPTGQTFGSAPALASGWGQAYFEALYSFYEDTGFLQFTHDGSYPGDLDASPRPPLQRGAEDSRWVQWKIITDYYKWLRERGVYNRVPDYYYLSGSNECGMGYRETNWSLPRAQQVIHTRQNIFDGTWEKTPSMGWMFVPLTQYHGGGAAATIEPLDEHLEHYERMITSNLGLGVQAVYRGTRLYDTPRVRDMVIKWTTWFKAHRDILESDVVHGKRADGRGLDWMLHVNPVLGDRGGTRGMLVVFNPTSEAINETLTVDLYYTGAADSVTVIGEDGELGAVELERDYTIGVPVRVPPGSMAWYAIE